MPVIDGEGDGVLTEVDASEGIGDDRYEVDAAAVVGGGVIDLRCADRDSANCVQIHRNILAQSSGSGRIADGHDSGASGSIAVPIVGGEGHGVRAQTIAVERIGQHANGIHCAAVVAAAGGV